MRKTELREVMVCYCDVCGAEILGNMTTFNQGQADEKHACHSWIEAEEIRCDQKLVKQIQMRCAGHAEDDPVLVFWKASLLKSDGAEWQPLTGHDCNGFRIDYFNGFVIELRESEDARPLLDAIMSEEFCLGLSQSDFDRANADSLDYGVEEPHRKAYKDFLKKHGLEAGRLDLLQQAVYPLAPTAANLERLGVAARDIPPGAELVVLGDNCD